MPELETPDGAWEGTWAELALYADRFGSRRLRLTILPDQDIAAPDAPGSSEEPEQSSEERKHPTRSLVFGPDPVIEAYKKDVDRTLLRENLKLTVEERILKMMSLQRFAEELRGVARREPRE